MRFLYLKAGLGGGRGKQKELTEEQKQEIKEAFDLFDTDGSPSNFFFGRH